MALSILKSDFGRFLLAAAVSLFIIFAGFHLLPISFNIEAVPSAEEPAELAGEVSGGEIPRVTVEILQEGTGDKVSQNGDSLSVHYTGTLEDGTKFDSSLDRGQPFTFTLGSGGVIQGWEQGMLTMKVGEKRKLIIPSELGYGGAGVPTAGIPANATLIFEVELLSIN